MNLNTEQFLLCSLEKTSFPSELKSLNKTYCKLSRGLKTLKIKIQRIENKDCPDASESNKNKNSILVLKTRMSEMKQQLEQIERMQKLCR